MKRRHFLNRDPKKCKEKKEKRKLEYGDELAAAAENDIRAAFITRLRCRAFL